MIKASAVFDCGDAGRLRGPAAQERELEHLIDPYAQHLDASSRRAAEFGACSWVIRRGLAPNFWLDPRERARAAGSRPHSR